ncbi:DUF4012 domain-containing protein [Pseudarthrobacter sp. NPDC089323]
MSIRRGGGRLWKISIPIVVFFVLIAASAAWLQNRAGVIRDELAAATDLMSQLKDDVASKDALAASSATGELRAHTAAAREAANDPLWTLATAIPGIGANFGAISEVTRSAEDVAVLGISPLVDIFSTLKWEKLVPGSSGADLEAIQEAAPRIASAAHAVRESTNRLNAISVEGLLPQVSEPLIEAREELAATVGPLDAAASTTSLVPAMMGSDAPRNYLLMIQNNAEVRSSGGIPGALAVLTLEGGKMSLTAQSSAADVGSMSPTLAVDPEQKQIYTARLGKYMQDVNLTPDFPTAASTAQAMWERKTGQRVQGVLSIDPVVLSYLLSATGPISLNDSELAAGVGLPPELTSENVVSTLLSDAYVKIKRPEDQDKYFAGVAREIFASLSEGRGDALKLVDGIVKGVGEGRVLVWSDSSSEQAILAKYPIGGSITGPSVAPAQFGVYFNDGTGAKMDYYVKRTVQLLGTCSKDGYAQTVVRVISTNTAPPDAATTLPAYVTGGGVFGVPPGTVQTNLVAYGPAQAHVETADVDGQKTNFAPHKHGDRPVAVLAMRLAPGETKSVDFTFDKIVQHTEPNLVVTPTLQPVNEVILPSKTATCG